MQVLSIALSYRVHRSVQQNFLKVHYFQTVELYYNLLGVPFRDYKMYQASDKICISLQYELMLSSFP